jgi:predicted metal-dependent hydrolase
MLNWPLKFLTKPVVADPVLETIEVAHDGATYAVKVRRSASARRLILRVKSDTGDVVLTLPRRSSLAAAREFASRQGGWIATRLARLPSRQPFTPGAIIPFRGAPHRLELRPGHRGPVHVLSPSGDEPGVIAVISDPAHFARRVLDFLKAEAGRDLKAAAHGYAGKLGVRIARISIKDTRSRWGSCSAAGALSFSWRLILAPHEVLDYLAAHEVAHRVELNHSNRYWKLVSSICPHWRAAENWLTRHGAELHRYGPVGGRPTGR